MQVLVLGEELEHQAISAMQVARVARQRHPPERPLALAEQGPDVLGNEARDVERVGDACVPRLGANVVAVIEGHRSATLEAEHRLHVRRDARHGTLQVLRRRAPPQRPRPGSTSTATHTPSIIVAASGWAPPMPPSPPVRTMRPRSDPPKCRRAMAPNVS